MWGDIAPLPEGHNPTEETTMAEAQKSRSTKSNPKVEGFLRESVEVAQARLETLEAEAQKLLHEVQTRLPEGVREGLGRGSRAARAPPRGRDRERAEEWKDKAQEFRVDAAEKLENLQVAALSFLGVATREEVAELSREINKILKRLDESRKRKAGKPTRKPVVGQA